MKPSQLKLRVFVKTECQFSEEYDFIESYSNEEVEKKVGGLSRLVDKVFVGGEQSFQDEIEEMVIKSRFKRELIRWNS